MDPIECKMNKNPKQGSGGGGGGAAGLDEQASMNSLILWNITKALERNPKMNLEGALREAEQHLCSSAYGAVSRALANEQRHLTCALLAWQQLGHHRVDSLLQFVESREKAKAHVASLIHDVQGEAEQPQPQQFKNYSDCKIKNSHLKMNGSRQSVMRPVVMGPVVTLPCLARPPRASPPYLARPLVMCVEDNSGQLPTSSRRYCKGPSQTLSAAPQQSLRGPPSKISELQQRCSRRNCRGRNTAESFTNCADEAAEEDSATSAEEPEPADVSAELRARTRQLARRQAQRAELLQRAEAAWQDLERGFQKKLQLSKEKEDNIAKQLAHLVEEYEEYKKVTSELDDNVKKRIAAVEADKNKLMEIEKSMCELACTRHQLTEDANKKKGTLSEQQCKCLQYERDNQFKEEQAKNKMNSVKNDLDAAKLLALEAERIRSKELQDLKSTIAQTAKALKNEEDENDTRTEQLEQLKKEKERTEKSLGECKLSCETAVSEALEGLRRRRLELGDMEVTVTECRCQLPSDAAAEAKRTPSLALVCYCPCDGKPLKGCSCTTLRSRLLTDLLYSLFGGLQEELGLTGSTMPCQLLKCLDDKHNWDRCTDLKIHLKNYFLQLLVGEIEIAIAASIEMYHAKWIGACCADRGLPCHVSCQESQAAQRCVVEARAHELAEELMKQQSVASQHSRETCRCETRVYTCQVQPQTKNQGTVSSGGGAPGVVSAYWRKTHNHVTLLRSQIEDLKRESIKKTDLSLMEQKIVKLVQRASGPNRAIKTYKESKDLKRNLGYELDNDKGEIESSNNMRDVKKLGPKSNKPKYQAKSIKEMRNVKVKLNRCDTNEQIVKFNEFNRTSISKRESAGPKRRKSINQCKVGGKKTVTVNMCYTVEKDDRTLMEAQPDIPSDEDEIPVCETAPTNTESNIFCNAENALETNLMKNESQHRILCKDSCVCFNKIPSSISVNEVFESLSNKRKNKNACVDVEQSIKVQLDSRKYYPLILKRSERVDCALNNLNKNTELISPTNAELSIDNQKRNINIESASKDIGLKCNTGSVCLNSSCEIPEKDILENKNCNLNLPMYGSVKIATFSVHSSSEINKVTNHINLDTLNGSAAQVIKLSNQSKDILKSNNISKVTSPRLCDKFPSELSESISKKGSSLSKVLQVKCNIADGNSKYFSKNDLKKRENIISEPHEPFNRYVTSSKGDMGKNYEAQKENKEKTPTNICIDENENSNEITSLNYSKEMHQITSCMSKKSNFQSGNNGGANQERNFTYNDTPMTLKQDVVFGITAENYYPERKHSISIIEGINQITDEVVNKIVDELDDSQGYNNYSLLNLETNENATEEKSANVRFSAQSKLEKSGNETISDNYKNTISNQISGRTLLSNNVNNYQFTGKDQVCGTESEYMGEINLDKSIEHNCRCGADSKLISDFDFKCINSKLFNATNCKCQYDEHETRKEPKTGCIKNVTTNELLLDNLPVHPLFPLSASNKFQNTDTIRDINNNKMKGNIKETIYDIIRKSNSFPCNYDYDVNFLGVTLKNDNHLKPYKTEILDNYNVKTVRGNKNNNTIIVPLNKKNNSHNKINKAVVTDKTSKLSEKNSCKCNQLIEIEGVFDKVFSQYNRTRATKDEALDTQSLMRDLVEHSCVDEPCVCCNDTCVKEESENLEVNTFELLREHFKKKIDEFTSNPNYESNKSCISKDEEEKLLLSILQNVKEVILKNTDIITCKCNEEVLMDDTWNRAYILLQEYLKTKIQRVKCSCSTTVENDRHYLSEILNKVSEHIDNDFERLKNRCKPEISKLLTVNSLQKPEKDNISQTSKAYIKTHDPIVTADLKDLSAKIIQKAIDESTQKSFVRCDVPSQVSRYFDAQSKGCGPLVFTVHNGNQSSLEFESKEKVRCSTFSECLCDNDNKNLPINDAELHGIRSNTDNFENNRKCSEIIGDNIDQALALPYVGCTIQCSCDDPLSHCDCAKCAIRQNNHKTRALYNHYLDKSHPQNVAYIMENTKKPTEKIYEHYLFDDEQVCKHEPKTIATEVKSVQYVCNTRRNTMTSVSSPETMILKNSSSINRRKKLTTNTFVENIFGSCPSADGHLPLVDNVENVPGDPIYFPIGWELSEVASQNCDCKTVPICHVKMLVEDIEKRLADCRCVCDSMIPKVCPVHSSCN